MIQIHAIMVKLLDVSHQVLSQNHLLLKLSFCTVFIKEEAGLFTRKHKLRLTEIPNGTEVFFVYRRPAVWQALDLGLDLFYNIRYDEDFEFSSQATAEINHDDENGILRFFRSREVTCALIEAFKEGVQQKSRFGFTLDSLRAMQGLSLTYRVLKQYAEAESILAKALALAHSATTTDLAFQLQILYEFGALYLDQQKLSEAEMKFLFIEKAIRQQRTSDTDVLRLQVIGGLATVALRRQLLLQAESLLRNALSSQRGLSRMERLARLALQNQLNITCCAQDRLIEARAMCETTLSEQEEYIEQNHYHILRTRHCLAKVLYEQGLSTESEVLYQRQLEHLHAILGLDHLDVLGTMESLAQIYYDQYDLERSQTLWQQLCEKYEIVLGGRHPTTWEARYQLAQSLRDAGKEELAVDVLEHILTEVESTDGPNQYLSRRIMFVLQDLYRHLGNAILAKEYRKKLLGLNASTPGKIPPIMVSAVNNSRTC
jgi:tetratricopeptide (TPR) repeat protein